MTGEPRCSRADASSSGPCKGSSLVALGPTVPGFLASAARAAEPGKDTVLVVVEMTGGNDGLNTVIPYADDLYHAARPTIRLSKEQVVRVDDHVGLNPGMRSFEKLLSDGQLAIVQGVGYPNPDRSHFESMDVWQTADPSRKVGGGWLGRGLDSVRVAAGQIPGIYVGTQQLPLAMRGSATGVPTVHPSKPYDLDLALQPRNPYGYAVAYAPPGSRAAEPAVDKHQAARRAPDRRPREALAGPRRPPPVRPPDVAPDLCDDRGPAQDHRRRPARTAGGFQTNSGTTAASWRRTSAWSAT